MAEDFNIVNRRRQIRLSTVSGVVPTIPGSGATSIYYPDSTWLDTDIMIGELFMNSADERIWTRTDSGLIELGYSGMTGSFLGLADTPSTFLSQGGKGLRVNNAENAIEFYTITADTFSITGADDYEFTGSPSDGQVLTYSTSDSGFTLTSVNNSFTGLTDTPSTYTADQFVKVNSTASGITTANIADWMVDLANDQTVGGDKTFTGDTTMTGGTTTIDDLSFAGTFETVNITNISTDNSFSAATDNELATSLSVKNYVLNTAFGSGVTNFVTIDTTQSITGQKTFNNAVTFNSGLTLNSDLTINSDLIVSGSTYNDLTSYVYFGNESTNGSFRFYIDPSGGLTIEKRVSGTWTFVNNFNV